MSKRVTHEQASESHQRMVHRAFGEDHKPQPRLSIPARPDYDDDLLLGRYIREQAERDDLGRRAMALLATNERVSVYALAERQTPPFDVVIECFECDAGMGIPHEADCGLAALLVEARAKGLLEVPE